MVQSGSWGSRILFKFYAERMPGTEGQRDLFPIESASLRVSREYSLPAGTLRAVIKPEFY